MNYEKKVYTMEDNVRTMTFAMRDVIKNLTEINEKISRLYEKMGEADSPPEGDQKIGRGKFADLY